MNSERAVAKVVDLLSSNVGVNELVLITDSCALPRRPLTAGLRSVIRNDIELERDRA